ncbi:hypothetical protein D3C78_1441790 [compost metagenome]
MAVDLFFYEGILIVGGGVQLAAEGGLAVVDDERQIQAPFVAHQQWPVVGDQVGPQAEDKQHGKNPQRPVAAAVAAKTCPARLVNWA